MAKPPRMLSTAAMLIIFLLIVAVLVFGALYLDSRHKNELLSIEVERLQQSQVLLMVPDEQAHAVASWMSEHPESTLAFASQVKPGEKVTLEVGPGVNDTDVQENSPCESPLALKPEIMNRLSVPKSLAKVPLEQPTVIQSVKPSVDTHKSAPKPVKQAISLISDDLNLAQFNEKSSVLAETTPERQTLSVDEDGVKVISLPHGGIRVTTREND